QAINIPFIHGKCLLPLKLLQEKFCGITRVIVEALLHGEEEFKVLAPLPIYAGVDIEAYLILEESLSKNYIARLEDIFQTPESSPIGPSPAPIQIDDDEKNEHHVEFDKLDKETLNFEAAVLAFQINRTLPPNNVLHTIMQECEYKGKVEDLPKSY
ncbi:hypothetical protein L7F22_026806, partial [Adiantum nelumboides]|nr:hypothetical protein [Adiantum nelumboides]